MSAIAWLQLAVVALSVAVITLGVVVAMAVSMVRKQVDTLEGHLITLLTALLVDLEGGERHE
jgi:hypothetical protein